MREIVELCVHLLVAILTEMQKLLHRGELRTETRRIVRILLFEQTNLVLEILDLRTELGDAVGEICGRTALVGELVDQRFDRVAFASATTILTCVLRSFISTTGPR